MAITLDGTNGVTTPDLTVDTDTLTVDATNNRVGIGTGSPTRVIDVIGDMRIYNQANSPDQILAEFAADMGTNTRNFLIKSPSTDSTTEPFRFTTGNAFSWEVDDTEVVNITDSGIKVGTTENSPVSSNTAGILLGTTGVVNACRNGATTCFIGRVQDGYLMSFSSGGTSEGSISISGTTTSFNGGHLSRWSQLADNTRDESIVKGTVMSNLDQMAEWTTDGVTEENEQLNCMKVSDVEGDLNVAGVFVNWDNDDDIYTNDMNIAMTGDMVIRIAQGVTVQRGDLLMSAGDGTAKPQGDDIVRSKTIAKVTSTTVSNTYDDGSYLVPCVLMAC